MENNASQSNSKEFDTFFNDNKSLFPISTVSSKIPMLEDEMKHNIPKF